MVIRNYVHRLANLQRKEPRNAELEEALQEAKQLYHKSMRHDRLNFYGNMSMTDKSIPLDEYWKMSRKIVTGTSNKTKCPFKAAELAKYFHDLEWKDRDPTRTEHSFDFSKEVAKHPKLGSFERFKFSACDWESEQQGTSIKIAWSQLKRETRDLKGLNPRFLNCLPE